MKKILLIVFTLGISFQAHAIEWFGFEVTLGCVLGGAGGYAATPTSQKSQQSTNAGIGCAVGALIGYGLNSYYDSKFGNQYQRDLKDKDKMIQEMQYTSATKVINGEDETTDGVIILEQTVPAKRLPDGTVIMPTKRKKIVVPGEGMRIGE